MTATRAEEFGLLAEQIRSWLALGIEPQAIGVTARSASLVREARQVLKADGIMTVPLRGRGDPQAVRVGTMHAMKGLEFQAVAVIGVERGLVPEPATITPENEDPAAYAQDLQRERCVLFVACTRARDHLYVSGTGEPCTFLPAREPDPPQSERDGDARARMRCDHPSKVDLRELLWAREESWRPRLRSVSLTAEAELRPGHVRQVAAALGQLYAGLQHPQAEGEALLSRWPACLAAAMAGVAATDYRGGTYWRALWKATGVHGTSADEGTWGRVFNTAIGRLGMATFPDLPLDSAGAIGMHAAVPAHCLSDYFRVLLSRRRLDTAMDTESFLAWVTTAGRNLPQLGEPARQFLLNGGDYAYDLVDRTLDLLGLLTEPDPDFDAVRLPGYLIEAAKKELATGRLDLSLAGRHRTGGQGGTPIGRQVTPRVAFDAQPRLQLDDPIPGVATPGGSPVYPVPPQLRLPRDRGTDIRWHAEVSRANGGASARLASGPADSIGLWEGIPRPVLGAFEITVRGPLGRRLRAEIFIAEGLSVTYQPQVRPLTGAGLAAGSARLAAADGATAQPTVLRFGPRDVAHAVEYRTAAAAEPLFVTPPHVAAACPGAGVATWTTSQIHLVAEDFANAGRLLIRFPPSGPPGLVTENDSPV
ncbi:MAG: 3'-5' exonuclease, partial [Trebonia sp.]